MNRRSVLRLGGLAAIGSVAGCAAVASDPPDVDPNTGLDRNPAGALDNVPVFLAGETSTLPEVPMSVDSLADARVALATPDAWVPPLAEAFRNGTTVAFAGDKAPDALASLLVSVRDEFHYGIETIEGTSVETTVAIPHGDTIETYQFVDEEEWDDPTLDPVGWALDSRLPDCQTFIPESTADDQYTRVGAAWIVGRLSAGETYAARTTGYRRTTPDVKRLRLRTTIHAAANDGYAIETAVREADLPDDQHLHSVAPNPHTQNGVQVTNASDTVRSTFGIELTPDSPRARSALTGCGRFRTEGPLAYDYRTSVRWKRDELLDTDRHYATATGRGEWALGGAESDPR